MTSIDWELAEDDKRAAFVEATTAHGSTLEGSGKQRN